MTPEEYRRKNARQGELASAICYRPLTKEEGAEFDALVDELDAYLCSLDPFALDPTPQKPKPQKPLFGQDRPKTVQRPLFIGADDLPGQQYLVDPFAQE